MLSRNNKKSSPFNFAITNLETLTLKAMISYGSAEKEDIGTAYPILAPSA